MIHILMAVCSAYPLVFPPSFVPSCVEKRVVEDQSTWLGFFCVKEMPNCL